MKIKKNKLVKDVDEELWRKFVAYCKIKNVKVSDELNRILDEYINKKLRKILK